MKYALLLVILLSACTVQANDATPTYEERLERLQQRMAQTPTREQAIEDCVQQFLEELPTYVEVSRAEVPMFPTYSPATIAEACEKDIARRGYSEQTRRILDYLDQIQTERAERYLDNLTSR